MTIDHILADIPCLVEKVKEDLNSINSRVITFGSRIGGAVAALARKKFPHLIQGAWSTSGLFRAIRPETDFFNEISEKLKILGTKNCNKTVSRAFQQLKEIIDTKDATKLRQLFTTRDPIDLNDRQDVQFFYNAVFQEIPLYLYYKK